MYSKKVVFLITSRLFRKQALSVYPSTKVYIFSAKNALLEYKGSRVFLFFLENKCLHFVTFTILL